MTQLQLLPEAGAATLLRALLKGPAAAGATAVGPSTFRLERLDDGQIRRYNALLGFARDALPLPLYYLPTQRAHLATMLRAEFPFRPAGMIHVENDIRELRTPEGDQPMELATDVVIEPPAANGARFCALRTVGSQQGRDVFECRSRYLALRGERRIGSGERGADAAAPVAGQAAGEWSLAANAGRQYASVSGDWNPIHLWPWSARLLGMKTPIIHGMHTVAKAAALLEQRQGRRLTAISARFKAPIALGSTAELRLVEPAGGYQVWSAGTLAVEGSFG